MLRLNRTRAIGAVCLVIFLYYLVFTDSSSTTSTFRASTEAGLARERSKQQHYSHLRGDLSDQDLTAKTQKELDAILGVQDASLGANAGGIEDDVINQGDAHGAGKGDQKLFDSTSDGDVKDDDAETVPVAGRKTMPKQKPKYPLSDDKEKALKDADDAAALAKDRTTEDGSGADTAKDIAREKLQEYLKHPIVIFSKSYCPHSKKAKHLLTSLYTITPPPTVVELDLLTESLPTYIDSEGHSHSSTLGAKIQQLLGEMTGRKTVPNIMVGGLKSIGGNDLIWQLHEEGKLVSEIRSLVGKRVTEIKLNNT